MPATTTKQIAVTRRNIIGTRTVILTAWEPTTIMGRHGTITCIAPHDGWFGQIGTDPDNSSYDHLPSKERTEASQRAYNERYEYAYLCIRQAFPSDNGTMSDGQIVVYDCPDLYDATVTISTEV